MKILFAEFTARQAREGEVDELLRGLIPKVQREPGNVTFEAYKRAGDPRRYFVFEIYRDEQAFLEHLASSHCIEFNAGLVGLIEEPASNLTWLSPLGIHS